MTDSSYIMNSSSQNKYFNHFEHIISVIIYHWFCHLSYVQVGAGKHIGGWGQTKHPNTPFALQYGRSAPILQHRGSRENQYFTKNRKKLHYQLPASLTRYKNRKTDKRSLRIANSKSTADAILEQGNPPKSRSVSPGLSSFPSFNTLGRSKLPSSQFSCRDRAPGYYADIELDCKVRG